MCPLATVRKRPGRFCRWQHSIPNLRETMYPPISRLTRLTLIGLTAVIMYANCPAASAALSAADQKLINQLDADLTTHKINRTDAEKVEGLLKRNPNEPQSQLIAGEVFAQMGLEHQALEEFNAAQKTSPQIVLNEFHRLLREQPNRAPELVWYAAQQFPHDSGVLYQEGRLCIAREKIDDARLKLEQAVRQAKPWPDSYACLSKIAMEANLPAKAALLASEELKLYPDNMRARRMQVIAKYRLGTAPESMLPEIRILLKDRPNDQYMNFLLGSALSNQGKFSEALKPSLFAIGQADNKSLLAECSKLISAELDNVPAPTMAAAIDDASPASSKNIVSTLLRFRLADIYSKRGDHVSAKRQYLTALNMHPYLTPVINFKLAQELEQMHDDKTAVFFYNMAKQQRPDEPEYRRAAERAEMRYSNKSNDLARRLKDSLVH